MRFSTWKRWTVAGAAGVVLLVGGLAIGASAASGSPPSGAPPSRIALPTDPSRVGPLFGVVHGDLHLQRYDGSTVDLAYDGGRITSRTATSITFVRLDGRQVTVGVGPQTIVREGLRPARAASLRVGERAMFFSRRNDDGSLTAVLIRCVRLGLRG
jgi:hypothetical protein